MKQSHALFFATTLAVSAALAPAALASSSKLAAHAVGPKTLSLSIGGEGDDGGALPGGGIAHGSIGSAPPSTNAASSLRSLGGDDGPGSDDGGALPGGKIAHGSIGSALPSTNAAGRLRSLGGSDN